MFSHTETRTRQRQVKVGTRTVVVERRDLGNGNFENITKEEPVYETRDESYEHRVMKKEPVYGTWYRYELMKWMPAPPATDQKPAWPEVTLEANQREQTRTETYEISVRDDTSTSYASACPSSSPTRRAKRWWRPSTPSAGSRA